MRDGWFDRLRYFLQDLRPAGFMGRRFARAHARVLQLGDDPRQWSDDDVLHAISAHGADQSGNFVVGQHPFRLGLDEVQQPPAHAQEARVLDFWSRAADDARISTGFRAICADNVQSVRTVRRYLRMLIGVPPQGSPSSLTGAGNMAYAIAVPSWTPIRTQCRVELLLSRTSLEQRAILCEIGFLIAGLGRTYEKPSGHGPVANVKKYGLSARSNLHGTNRNRCEARRARVGHCIIIHRSPPMPLI